MIEVCNVEELNPEEFMLFNNAFNESKKDELDSMLTAFREYGGCNFHILRENGNAIAMLIANPKFSYDLDRSKTVFVEFICSLKKNAGRQLLMSFLEERTKEFVQLMPAHNDEEWLIPYYRSCGFKEVYEGNSLSYMFHRR